MNYKCAVVIVNSFILFIIFIRRFLIWPFKCFFRCQISSCYNKILFSNLFCIFTNISSISIFRNFTLDASLFSRVSDFPAFRFLFNLLSAVYNFLLLRSNPLSNSFALFSIPLSNNVEKVAEINSSFKSRSHILHYTSFT